MKDFPNDKKIFEIQVHTNKKKTQIVSFEPFIMDVSAIPQNNKANIKIIKFFKKNFGINICIKKGITSKKKLIEVINHNI